MTGPVANKLSRQERSRIRNKKFNNFLDSKSGVVVMWVLGIIFLIPWLVTRALSAALRLVNPRYRSHMRMFKLQNLHLDGLHDEGPDPSCEYCDETVRYYVGGGYYRPWSERGLNLSSGEETQVGE